MCESVSHISVWASTAACTIAIK